MPGEKMIDNNGNFLKTHRAIKSMSHIGKDASKSFLPPFIHFLPCENRIISQLQYEQYTKAIRACLLQHIQTIHYLNKFGGKTNGNTNKHELA